MNFRSVSLGSAKSSTTATNRNKSNSTSSETISKYFTEKLLYEAPLKDIKDIKALSLNDSSDFQSPIPTKKFRKVVQPPPKRKYVRKSKDKLVQSRLELKQVKNFESEGLQLALALSKSLHESKVDSGEEIECEPVVYPSTQEVRLNIKRTLEQYGFRSKKALSNEDAINQALIEVPNRRRKPRFTTPILFIRTEADRQKLIEKKVASILNTKPNSNIQQTFTLSKFLSKKLQKYVCKSARIYGINTLDFADLDCDKFYVHELNLQQSENKCGSFLKNWHEIPGREATPPREIQINQFNAENKENVKLENSFKKSTIETSEVFECNENNLVEIKENCNILDEVFENIDKENLNEKNCDHDNTFSCLTNGNSIFIDNTILITEDGFNDEISSTYKSSEANENNFGITNYSTPIKFSDIQNSPNKSINCTTLKVKKVSINCISPDLFDSEDDQGDEVIHTNFVSKNDNGICHFESFHDDEINFEVSPSDDQKSPLKTPNFRILRKISPQKSILFTEPNLSPLDNCMKSSHSLESIDLTESDDDSKIQPNNEKKSISSEKSFKRNDSMNSIESNASIEISDEELNFSSLNANVNAKNKFVISSDSEDDDDLVYSKRFKDLIGLSISRQVNCNKSEESNSQNNFNKIDYPKGHESATKTLLKHPRISELQKFAGGSNKKQLSTENESEYSKNLNPLNDQLPVFESNFDVSVQANCSNVDMNISIEPLGNITAENNIDEVPINETNHSEIPKIASYEITTHEKLSSPINSQITEVDITPDKNLIIKTNNITPMGDYESMNSPEILVELQKYGIKKLKRHRAVTLLKYLYESTHPTLDDERPFPKKRRKLNLNENEENYSKDENSAEAQDDLNESTEEIYKSNGHIEITEDLLNIGTDIILEKERSKKRLTCNLPLHIAWHNLVMANPSLHEDILLYEPIKVEKIYSMFKEQGIRYEIKDLIGFLDKKCITIKVNQKNTGKK